MLLYRTRDVSWWIRERERDGVGTFDADVSVQCCCDGSGKHGEYIPRCLEIVGAYSEVAGVDRVLALIAVHEEAIEHVPTGR